MKPMHTPGPWRVEPRGNTYAVETDREYGDDDAICLLIIPLFSGVGRDCLPYDERMSRLEANARLIAAAPNLLAALQCLRGEVCRRGFPDKNFGVVDAVRMIDDAITKALEKA